MKKYTIRYWTLKGVSDQEVKIKVSKKLNIDTTQIDVPLEAKKGSYQGMIAGQSVEIKVTTNIIMILLLLALLMFALGTAYWLTRDTTPKAPLVDTNLLPESSEDVQTMSKEELLNAMQNAVDGENFNLQINSVATFTTGDSVGSIQIINPPNNTNPMAVEIYLKTDGTLLYKSGGISPEQYVSKGKLMKKLDKGTYDALAKVRIYDEETNKEITVTEVEMKIIVEN